MWNFFVAGCCLITPLSSHKLTVVDNRGMKNAGPVANLIK
jgi:hypothetical protein